MHTLYGLIRLLNKNIDNHLNFWSPTFTTQQKNYKFSYLCKFIIISVCFFLINKKNISLCCFYKFVLYLWTGLMDIYLYFFFLFNLSRLSPHITPKALFEPQKCLTSSGLTKQSSHSKDKQIPNSLIAYDLLTIFI